MTYSDRTPTRDDGFTLIELLIVVVMLGILAGIALFGVGTFQQDAKDACSTTSSGVVRTAQLAYEVHTGKVDAPVPTLVAAGYLDSAGNC